jgi:hypothetical protein
MSRRLLLPARRPVGVVRRATGPSVQDRSAPLSRRSLLRGVFRGSAVALSLPFLELFLDRRALACGGAIPKRFGLYCWGNGNIPSRWTPTGSGTDWELSEQLASLAPVKDLVTVVSGFSVKLTNAVPHSSGAAGLLSGAPMQSVGDDETFSAPSVDNLVADEIGGDTLYRSLQTGATGVSGLSYTGPSSRNPPETDPYALYERLFGDTFREPGAEVEVDPTLGLRRSVLDAVMEDVAALQARVGAADKARLEAHLDGVRELEQRLARLEEDPPNLAACARADSPTADFSDVDGRPQISARSRAMVDLLALALACDQTRVFSHYLTDPVGDVLFPGASAGHHSLTHDEGGDQPEVHAITQQCVAEFAYLVEKFASIDEGDGSLLDNSVVLCCSEVSLGQTHSLDEMPLVYAGGCCGTLRTGYHLRSDSQDNASELMLTLMRAMDLSAPDFGVDEAWTEDTLTELEL